MSYLIWQLVDSGFPAGGFAHSGGLEASVHHGLVIDDATLRSFARQTLGQCGRSALPLVTAAHANPDDLTELHQLSDVFLSNSVANRASRAQARALLTSAARSFPRVNFGPLEERARRDQVSVHYAPIFGAVLARLGADRREAQRLFLFLTGRAVGSAAVRLGLIGAYDAQALQAVLSDDIDTIIDRCAELGPLDIVQTAPLIDLCQATHDRLYSRLFQS